MHSSSIPWFWATCSTQSPEKQSNRRPHAHVEIVDFDTSAIGKISDCPVGSFPRKESNHLFYATVEW
jgi:hypothetical protein